MRPLWFLGYPDQSLSRIQETVTLARALKHPISIVFAVALAENIHLLRGEAAEAVFLGDEMIAVCREYGLAQEVEWGRCFQALALADLGRVDEGVAQLRDSLAVQARHARRAAAADVPRPSRRSAAQGRPSGRGAPAVDEGFEAAERGLERYYVAELHRLRGELLRRKGDEAAAERSFGAAIDFARTQGAKSLELRAATGLARLLQGRCARSTRRGRCWRGSTAGSPRASRRETWSRPGSCSTSCAERRVRARGRTLPFYDPSFSHRIGLRGTTAAWRAPAVAQSSATECTRVPG